MTQRAKEMLELADVIEAILNAGQTDALKYSIGKNQYGLVVTALRLAAQADAPGEQADIPSSAEPACGDYSQASQHRSGDLQPGSAESDPGGLDAATVEACAKVAEDPRFSNITKVSTTKGPEWTEETGNAQLMNSHARFIAAAIRALGAGKKP